MRWTTLLGANTIWNALDRAVTTVIITFCLAGIVFAEPPSSEGLVAYRDHKAEQQAGNLARIQDCDVEEIIFAVRQPGKDGHGYANFGYWSFDPDSPLYGDGGRLCRLNLRTGELTVLLDDPQGGVRDPQVHYDGRKILFSYRMKLW